MLMIIAAVKRMEIYFYSPILLSVPFGVIFLLWRDEVTIQVQSANKATGSHLLGHTLTQVCKIRDIKVGYCLFKYHITSLSSTSERESEIAGEGTSWPKRFFLALLVANYSLSGHSKKSSFGCLHSIFGTHPEEFYSGMYNPACVDRCIAMHTLSMYTGNKKRERGHIYTCN